MVRVVKGIFAILLFLFVTTLVAAESIVNVSVSGISEVLKLSEVKEKGITFSVYFTCTECEKIQRSTEYLEVYVVKEPEKIVYQEILPININRNRLLLYTIPGEVFEDEGIYYIRITYRALTTSGSRVQTSREFSILVTEVEASALKVLRISPDLSKDVVFRFDRIPQTFRVEIYNAYEEVQSIVTKIEILDSLGRILLSRSVKVAIPAFRKTFVEIPVDFSLLLPGEYSLVLTINRNLNELYKLERKIIVGEEQYVPIKLYDIRQYPFTAKSEDFVELKLLLRNMEEKPNVAKVIIMSKDLEIYKESETIEFDARETKTLSFVLRIPKVEAKAYNIEILVQTGVATRKYMYTLYVYGEKPEPVEIRLIAPLKLELDKEEELKLIFKSNVEEINKFKLRVYASGAKVGYPEIVTVGGKGEIVEVPIKIKPTSLKSVISLEVYDITGKLVYKTTERYTVVVGANKILSYATKALLVIALIILAIILYRYVELKGKKKRKVEKAE